MKHKQRAVYSFVIFLIVALITVGVCANASQKQYIRFHVVANSDSPEDQALKLRVRDRLLERFGREFANIDSIETGREKIKDSIDEIERIAFLEIKRSGKSYPVQVQFGRFPFPTKAYGHLVLPAGEYEALKVVIGKGEGSNWWCVMFPPLCFIDISHGVAKQKDETATRGDNASQTGIAIEIQKPEPQEERVAEGTEAVVLGKSVDEEDEGYTGSGKPRYDESADNTGTSSSITGHADEQDGVKGQQRSSASYSMTSESEGAAKIEYRWKVVEWIKVSGVKIKRLFSFLSFWDR
ncbi:MAG: stage II sporulation protein R [Caldicoprobacter oshimai]|uniref:Stage II sporulation protein R n=1 Tax=Caldicoprobacter faecalis TaxID=937334 RepID=A0A1I5VYM1_9FIRM|nr:stage II sporulation protein R [Caldicoprobacter faecalis]SFQ12520.1 stage II sporulation protein R [Caldicoprobacter faecalis]